jgi:type II secretory pathway predicted ATPase ExeA
MYHAFYQLHTDPFRLTPDPAFCFRHQRYARALAYMQYALRQGEGFIMVTGLPGTGKTTLIEQFHSELNGARTLVAKLTSTQLQADELLRLICLSLGVSIEAQDKAGMLHQLRQFFVAQANKGRRTLLLIDEAQDLPLSALEELRLLGNLQLNARPLLQIFLVGQEQLLETVQVAAMRPLYQRLVAACHLEPLSCDETRAYIEYRLERAGWNGEPAFDARSYHMIHRFSEGFPRQINKVCSRLLLYGSTEKKRRLDCFDCLKVLKHWLEELPGSTSESSFEACVDMLNAAWSEAEGAAAGQAVGAAALQRSEQQDPPPGDAQAAAEPDPAPALPARADQAAACAQSRGASTPLDQSSARTEAPQAACARDGATHGGHGGVVEPVRAGNTPAAAATDAQPPVPRGAVTPLATPSRSAAGRKPHFARGLALLHQRAVGYAGAPLAVFAVLLSGLLLMSGEEHDKGAPEEPAAAQQVPAVAGGALLVAELAAPSSSSDRQTVPEGFDPGLSADRTSVGDAAEPSDGAAAQEPQRAAPQSASMEAAPDGRNRQLQNERGNDQDGMADSGAVATLELPAVTEQAAADGVSLDSGPKQDPGMTSAAAADSGSAAPAVQSADSGPLAAVEVVVPPAAPARAGAAAEVLASVAEPEAQQPDAVQQHINDLTARAERALREDRLTVPRGNSAYHYYRQVLKIAPQHQGARAGLQRIAARYTTLIERALANHDMDKARWYVARGLMVNPGNPDLLALRHDVEKRESWLAAQARAQTEAPRAPPPPAQKKPAQSFFDKVKLFFSNPVPRDMP